MSDCSRNGWSGNWTDSTTGHSGWFREKSAQLHPGLYRARQHGAYRRLAGLCGSGKTWLQPRDQPNPTPTQRGRSIVAAGAPRRGASGSLVVGNPPRSGVTPTPALLSGRVHIPLQSPQIPKSGQAVLPVGTASHDYRPDHLLGDRIPGQILKASHTTYSGYLSQVDTPSRVFAARKSVPITADRATILMNIKDL